MFSRHVLCNLCFFARWPDSVFSSFWLTGFPEREPYICPRTRWRWAEISVRFPPSALFKFKYAIEL